MKKNITDIVFSPHSEIILFNTNWNVQDNDELFKKLDKIEGVEKVHHSYKYSFVIEIGKVFDKTHVKDIILATIEEYFNN